MNEYEKYKQNMLVGIVVSKPESKSWNRQNFLGTYVERMSMAS